ncbi:MAG: AAA family ATPase [Porticoccaceae bacterium]|nr:AAA family ATPase [Porticoccaceae bacterium]
MKILQLRFLNLNSLLGEWQIDLTDPAFSNDGIFAITGPTGAGKSTILDAICLALYGRTPRLNKITKSSNEIMSRHSGECFAEITFATAAGQFRCHWSQHRARKKPDGDLQSPKHEIADALSGKIIEAKMRNVAERIEAITGMDFERFTLSMLLAQGSFAAFLQAAPDQRAPILEQITGSAIYSQISTRVHELRAIENNKLNTLQAELAGMTLLSTEDESQLKALLEQHKQRESELSTQSENYGQGINWLNTINNLEKELQDLDQQNQALDQRREAFKADAKKLEAGKRALPLAADYASLKALREAQHSEQKKEQQYRDQLPGKEITLADAKEKRLKHQHALAESRDAQSVVLPIIRQTQALDLQSKEQQAPIDKADAGIKALKRAITQLQDQQKINQQSLAEHKAQHSDLLKEIANSRADEVLVEQLSGLQGRLSNLRVLSANYHEKIAEHKQAKTECHNALVQWHKQASELTAQSKTRQELDNALTLAQEQRLQTLDGQDLAHWRNYQTSLLEKKQLLHTLHIQVTTLVELQDLQAELAKRDASIADTLSEDERQLLTHTEKHAALERELSLLDTQISLLHKIHSLDEARQQLEDGKPCPLCGANQHPYAEGNVPQIDSTSHRRNKVKTQLDENQQQLVRLKVHLAEHNKEHEQITSKQQETAVDIAKHQALHGQTLQQLHDLGVPLNNCAALVDSLPQLIKDNQACLDTTTQLVTTIEQQDQALAVLRTQCDTANKVANQLEQQHLTAGHQKDTAAKNLARSEKEETTLAAQLKHEEEALLRVLSNFGITSLPEDHFIAIEKNLIQRREQWLAKQLDKNQIEQCIENFNLQIKHRQQQLEERHSELKEQHAEHTALLAKQEQLKHKRQALFANKDPALEEARLEDAATTAQQQFNNANQALQNASQDLAQLNHQIKALVDSQKKRSAQLSISEEKFQQRLREYSFISEADFKMACISDDTRDKLSRQVELLDSEQHGISARQKDRKEQLDKERNKQLTERSIDKLTQDLQDVTKQLKITQQELGACQQKLDDNQKLRDNQRQRASAIDAQKLECERWNNLHFLIGSADGKKYRNFAQGLTFERLVGLANRQLQKMSDRYLLVRDKSEPLALNVVDNYQAGEIRSTKNLSGGESFIVSLALALGLSQMASKNVRVDSLFLDEGFGTLDEEALDTALEALSSLQQNGKLIGVISHVSSLKERIGTQILVMPQTGGRSHIRGPGCQRLI